MRVAIDDVFVQSAFDGCLNPRGSVSAPVLVLLLDSSKSIAECDWKRRPLTDEFERDDTKSKDIRGRGERFAADLFGRHVTGRSGDHLRGTLGTGQRRVPSGAVMRSRSLVFFSDRPRSCPPEDGPHRVGQNGGSHRATSGSLRFARWLVTAGDGSVSQLGSEAKVEHPNPPVIAQDAVFGLEVEMDDAGPMCRSEATSGIEQIVEFFRDRDFDVRKYSFEIASGDELHGEINIGSIGESDIVDRHDIWVVELSKAAGFLQKLETKLLLSRTGIVRGRRRVGRVSLLLLEVNVAVIVRC